MKNLLHRKNKIIRLFSTQVEDVRVFFPNDPEKRVLSFWAKAPSGHTSVLLELRRFQLDALSEILRRAEEP